MQVLHTCYYKLHVAVCISHSRAFLLNSYTTPSQQCNCLCLRRDRGREGLREGLREGRRAREGEGGSEGGRATEGAREGGSEGARERGSK